MTSADDNPYVGPRPFERNDRDVFFGRDGEALELLSLVVSERIVLLYAASGAGKTSLLNARVLPLLEELEGFEVYPVARIRAAMSDDELAAARNAYTLGLLISLAGGDADVAAETTLVEFLAARPHVVDASGYSAPRVLVIDQFEELFTLYTRYWRERRQFVIDIADALAADPLLRVVLAMREDYLAQLDPFAALLPRDLRTRFRLERLGADDAITAAVKPTHATNRTYAPGVAEKLVADLLRFRTDTGLGETIEVEGEYVEPVQLQVACQSLWNELPADVTEISEEHLHTFGDVDEVLRRFYDGAVGAAAAAARMPERRLRRLVEESLITSVGTRSAIYRRVDETAEMPNAAVDELENRHVIRAEWRAGARWYELTHDRLIAPIQSSNERFRSALARRRRRRAALVGTLVTLLALAALATALIVQPNGEATSTASPSGLSVDSMTLNVPSAPYRSSRPASGGRGNAYRVVLEPNSLTGNRPQVFGSLIDVRSGAVVSGPARANVDSSHELLGSPHAVMLWTPLPARAGMFQLSVLARSAGSKIELSALSPIFQIVRGGGPARPFGGSNALRIAIHGLGVADTSEDTCPPECSFVYAAPTNIRLTARAAPGWRFSNWSGCSRATPTCSVSVSRPTAVVASFVPRPRVEKIGATLTGKPINVVRLGDPAAKRKILVVGCLRPKECQGQRVIAALRKRLPPTNTELLLLPNLNPDNVGFDRPGISPNKAFPCNWVEQNAFSQACWNEPNPFTNEAQAAARLITRTRPALTLWYFARTPNDASTTARQRDLKRRYPAWVELIGDARAQAVARRFAKRVGLKPAGGKPPLEPNGGYPGSGSFWQAHEFPNAPAFWVTLPVGPLSAADANKHAEAILALARNL